MALGQVAATAASMAIDNNNCVVQDVDVAALKAELAARPLADDSKVDVLVDDANAANVRFEGKWKLDKSRRCYAYTRRYDNSLGKSACSAYFYPRLKEADEYKVYYYYPKQNKPSSVVNFNIFDGVESHKVELKTKKIKILGQTSGEWVYIGTYNIAKGDKPYVEITNQGADGSVVADAIQFVPKTR